MDNYYSKEQEVVIDAPSLTPDVDAALKRIEQQDADGRADKVSQFLSDNPGAPSQEYYDYDAMVKDGKSPEANDGLSFLPTDYYKSSRRSINSAWEYDVSSKMYQPAYSGDRVAIKASRDIVQNAFETLVHGPYTVARAGAEFAALSTMDWINDDESEERWEQVRTEMFERYDNPPELRDIRLESPETTQGMAEDITSEILTLFGDIGIAGKVLRVTKLDPTKARNFIQRQWDFLKRERGVALGEAMWSKTGTGGNLSTMLSDMGIGGELTEFLDSADVDNETETAIKNVIEGVVMSKFLQMGWMAGKKGAPALYDYLREYDPKTVGAPNTQKGMVAFHGSPHKFDKFKISQLGTGEGAQAYGHGMYLAESKEVAGGYASMVPTGGGGAAIPRRTFKGTELDSGTPEYHAATLATEMGESLEKTREIVSEWIEDANTWSPERLSQKSEQDMLEGWKKTLKV
ncbi:MAG: hypothetical protein DRI24_22900, partial [Deltaproteobacteria bacterium]